MDELFVVGTLAVVLGLGLTLSIWAVTSCLKSVLRTTNRSGEQERRDFIQLLEKLLEKRDVLPQNLPDLAAQHGTERMHRVSEDTRERVAVIPKASISHRNNQKGIEDIVSTEDLANAEAGLLNG